MRNFPKTCHREISVMSPTKLVTINISSNRIILEDYLSVGGIYLDM